MPPPSLSVQQAAVKSPPVNAAYVPEGDYWGVPEIAKYLGIEPGTVRDYAADPIRRFPEGIEVGGRKIYLVTAVKAWHEARPGQGRKQGPPADPSVS